MNSSLCILSGPSTKRAPVSYLIYAEVYEMKNVASEERDKARFAFLLTRGIVLSEFRYENYFQCLR